MRPRRGNGLGEVEGAEELLAEAAEQGFVTYAEIVAACPQAGENLKALRTVLAALAQAGVEVGASDADEDKESDEVEQVDKTAPLDPVALYLEDVGWGPLLSAEEEVKLARRIEAGVEAQERLDRDGLDPEERDELGQVVLDGLQAREHLVCANSRLVISIARNYVGYGVPFLDLIQEGNIGLMRTADRFDYRRGHKFSTYATWWIRQAITRAIAQQSRTIRLPVHVSERVNRMLRAAHRLTQELGHEPTPEDLGRALDIPARKAEEMLRWAHQPLSLEMPVDDDGESQLGDFIEDEDNPDLDEVIASSVLREVLRDMLQRLPPRMVRILQMRYGLVDGETYTLEEVGRKLGVTRERVRQIEVQALNRLRHPMRSRRLKDFLGR
jgi:RNA polymerase primary sigma factor